ncbi:MAG: prepilin-type N-terminal cleavage/methylation domain-containing protein [Candidatus Dependentiae bacterium]|nr:prepilin-type N-terminal cleavage/methylation domain-containing protein [Candidatus Dependentiae bacterium]
MKNNAGFLLIELVIGMAIASVVGLVLTNTLVQTNKYRAKIDDTVYIHSQAAVAQHQLEQDINTAFAPDMQLIAPEDESTPADKNATPDQKATPPAQKTAASPAKKKDEPLIKKIFYGTQNSDNNLDTLTLITTSPLKIYWGSKVGKAKARVARVIYRLIKDNDRPDSYTLYRQEGQDLNFDTYSSDKTDNARNYALVKNIKKLVMTYEVGIEKEPEKNQSNNTDTQATQKPKKPEIDYKDFTEWIQEAKETKNEDDSVSAMPRLPHTVTVQMTLWNREHSKETTFIFAYPIAWRDTPKKQPAKKQATPPNTSTASTSTSMPQGNFPLPRTQETKSSLTWADTKKTPTTITPVTKHVRV